MSSGVATWAVVQRHSSGSSPTSTNAGRCPIVNGSKRTNFPSRAADSPIFIRSSLTLRLKRRKEEQQIHAAFDSLRGCEDSNSCQFVEFVAVFTGHDFH